MQMQFMNAKSIKGINAKHTKFIAPGMLAKGRGCGKKIYGPNGESSGTIIPLIISLISF